MIGRLLARVERAAGPVRLEPMHRRHLRDVLAIERRVYPKPWTERIFADEIEMMHRGQRWYLVARAGRDVVGGHHPGPESRQEVAVDPGPGEPLVVDEVLVVADRTAEPEQVGKVLGGLEGEPEPGIGTAGGSLAVEALGDLEAGSLGHRTVEEPGREEFDLHPPRRKGRSQTAVVRGREGRGIDHLDAHEADYRLLA